MSITKSIKCPECGKSHNSQDERGIKLCTACGTTFKFFKNTGSVDTSKIKHRAI